MRKIALGGGVIGVLAAITYVAIYITGIRSPMKHEPFSIWEEIAKHSSEPSEHRIAISIPGTHLGMDVGAEVVIRMLEPHVASRGESEALAWQKLGEAYGRLSRNEDAIRAFRRVLSLEPGHGSADLISLGDTVYAIAFLEKAVVAGSSDEREILSALSHAYRRTGRISDAVVLLRRILDLDANNEQYWEEQLLNVGDTLYVNSRRASEIPALESAAAGPEANSPSVWGRLGRALEAAGRKRDAVRAYHRAALLEPRFGEWVVALVRLAPDSAIEIFRKIIESQKNDTRVAAIIMAEIGRIHERMGRRADASRAFEDAVRMEGGSEVALIVDLVRTGGAPRSVKVFEEICSGAGIADAGAWINMGNALLLNGRTEDAITAFNRAREIGGVTIEHLPKNSEDPELIAGCMSNLIGYWHVEDPDVEMRLSRMWLRAGNQYGAEMARKQAETYRRKRSSRH